MLDLETLEIIFNPLRYEVLAVIRYDSVRDPVLGNDVVPDELFHCHGYDSLIRGRLHPLGEVINHYQDIVMTIGGCRMYGPDDVNSPCRERPW